MKRISKNQVTLLFLLSLLGLIFINNQAVKQSIIFGGNLWFTKVFPSLFPMFILSNLLIAYHFPEMIANLFGRFFTKIFHTSSYGVFVFIMSLISGTPSNAYLLKELVCQKKITEGTANELISFTFFSNPLFLLSMLTLIFPTNFSIVVKIIFIHYASNLLIGFILRPKEYQSFEKLTISNEKISLGNMLTSSIQKSMNTLLMILGTICFYLMISALFTMDNIFLQNIFHGFLELTQGLNHLISWNISTVSKEIIVLLFLNFGGVSIHTQIKSIISDTNIHYFNFLKGRIFHVLIGTCAIIISQI